MINHIPVLFAIWLADNCFVVRLQYYTYYAYKDKLYYIDIETDMLYLFNIFLQSDFYNNQH